jgi:hypothetical protein
LFFIFAIFAPLRSLRSPVARNSSIARFVRQTRTMTYEKSAAAKNFFREFPVEIA